jgi:hypothetical protein
MANRSWRELAGTLDLGTVVINGSFAPNGSSAVSSASNSGNGWSVARTSTGLFTITLQDAYVAMLDAQLTLQLAAGDDKVLQLGAVDVVNAQTIQVRVWDISAAAVADIAANASNRIHFCLMLRNSSVAS